MEVVGKDCAYKQNKTLSEHMYYTVGYYKCPRKIKVEVIPNLSKYSRISIGRLEGKSDQ